MKRFLLILLPAALAAGPVVAGSDIYRTTDEDGNVVFTDEPPSDDAEPLDLKPLTTADPVEGEGEPEELDDADSGASDDEPDTPSNGLQGISIAYPENEKGIRHNGGNVPFEVALEPEDAALPRGHQIEIIVDGEVRERAASTKITVSTLDRGPHTVRARVIDNAGKTRYESDSVKFYLLRKALGSSGNN
ncbi:MAG: DUF4124 domain-containing protein [Halofilum sp. (in: g-proteobacteria)]